MWTNRLFDEMDRLFGRTAFDANPTSALPPSYPPLNVWEDENSLYVEAELPGLGKDEIEVSVVGGNTLTIAGERRPRTPGKVFWLRQECEHGRFSRTVTLPTVVNADAIEAAYEGGVLTLTLPRHEAARPRRIEVKTADLPALTEGKA